MRAAKKRKAKRLRYQRAKARRVLRDRRRGPSGYTPSYTANDKEKLAGTEVMERNRARKGGSWIYRIKGWITYQGQRAQRAQKGV